LREIHYLLGEEPPDSHCTIFLYYYHAYTQQCYEKIAGDNYFVMPPVLVQEINLLVEIALLAFLNHSTTPAADISLIVSQQWIHHTVAGKLPVSLKR
jgi:hypothetical protein